LNRGVILGGQHGMAAGGILGAAHGAYDPGAAKDSDGNLQQRNRIVGAMRGGIGGTILGNVGGTYGVARTMMGSKLYTEALKNISEDLGDAVAAGPRAPKGKYHRSASGASHYEDTAHSAKQASAASYGVPGALAGATLGGLYGAYAPGGTLDEQGSYQQRSRLMGALRGGAAGAALGGVTAGMIGHNLAGNTPDAEEIRKLQRELPTPAVVAGGLLGGGIAGAQNGAILGGIHGVVDPGFVQDPDGTLRERDFLTGGLRGAAVGGVLGGLSAGTGAAVGFTRGKYAEEPQVKEAFSILNAARDGATSGAVLGGLYGLAAPGYTQDEQGNYHQRGRLMGGLRGAVAGGAVGGAAGALGHRAAGQVFPTGIRPMQSADPGVHVLGAVQRSTRPGLAVGGALGAVHGAIDPGAVQGEDGKLHQRSRVMGALRGGAGGAILGNYIGGATGLGAAAREMVQDGVVPSAVKTADWKTELARRATGAGGLAGIGMGVGALGGAAHGALTNRDAQGNAAPISGALSGAMRGAQLGLAGGAVAGAIKPQWGTSALQHLAGREDNIGKMVRFGGRQVRSLTGVGDTKVLRGGLYDAQQALKGLQTNPKATADAISRAQQRVSILQDTHNRGLDHLPGLISSVRKDGLVPTMRDSLASQWRGGDVWDKGLLATGMALPLAGAAMAPADQQTAGNWGHAIGSTLGNMITPAHMPMMGALVANTAAETTGRLAGSAVDAAGRALAPRPAAMPQQPMVG
jgi:hypothetical protein